jgi:hypothetical protein
MLETEHKTDEVDIDASTLTYEEWFFISAAMGHKPDASLTESTDWRKRSLGMTQKEKLTVFRVGLEQLMQRGFVVAEKNSDGSPKMENGQQVYACKGKIISRIKAYTPKS